MPSPELLQSSDLPARIRARDPVALTAVVDAYMDQILRAARGAGLDQQQAEELTQQTFATFIEAAERFAGRSHVRTWIFGIFYRKLLEARRGFAKDARFDDIDDLFEARFRDTGGWSRPPRGPDQALLDKETLLQIESCLETLPDRQRLAFILREVEGLSSEEICNTVEVSRTNFGVMMFRARNRLRDCLETKWDHDADV